MLLYHATPIGNIESISENGLIPNITNAITNGDQIQLNGIYGFINIESARNFASYQDGTYVIYSFKTDRSEIIDPEYEGDAYFIETDDSIPATYECEA
jgi:hypothetical protein